ncbi:MAG TPA: adventurous gliding motility protein CglF [Anaeromyxobacteraceae bacterium]|nr:adventurous gliding motility protein CglF [Anaeromyxobacteraceae bacterium]
MRVIAILLVFALPLSVRAAEQKGQSPQVQVQYEKKTVIDFEDDTIQGDLTRPDGEYVEARKRVNHSNLIQVRENWREKVLQAPDDL